MGHRIDECCNKKDAEEKAKVVIDVEKENENKKVELAFDSASQTDLDHVCTIDGKTFSAFTKNTWIGDTRAFSHITNNDDGMFDLKTVNETVHKNSGTKKATSWERRRCKLNKCMKH